MESVHIIGHDPSSHRKDLLTLTDVCLDLELSLYVLFERLPGDPRLQVTTYDPYWDVDNEEYTQPHIYVHISEDNTRGNRNDGLLPEGYENYYWIMSFRCRQQQFMLPLLIALLEREPGWVLRNAEVTAVNVTQLRAALKNNDHNWAYYTE